MKQAAEWHEMWFRSTGQGEIGGWCVYRYRRRRTIFSDDVRGRGMGGGVIEKSVETKSSAQGREGNDGEAGVPWR